MPLEPTPASRKNLTVSLDFRIVSLILLLALIGLTIYTKPWARAGTVDARKITITGEATISAEPDEYVFYPSWEKPTQDEITALNDTTVKALKDLGVEDKDIKNNASVYDDYRVYPATELEQPEKSLVRTLSLTITVANKELAQKVQDYLLTTAPQGSITPSAQFSTEKQKQLEDQARTDAIADAKKRAESTATGLDAKVGKVIEVNETQSGGVFPMYDTKAIAPMSVDGSGAERSSLTVQPGENEFSYTVQVVFQLQ